jgi:DNA polymerase III sliding clamp (beta) subunit (PCNA family)
MIVKTEEFKEACQTILLALDTKEVSLYNEALELISSGSTLNLNVTNRQYYVTVKFNLTSPVNFKAVVKAKTFLSLVSKITTEYIELLVDDRVLKVKANGEYTFPLVFNNSTMLELPKINTGVVTNSFSINSNILLSILNNNSKELIRGAEVLKSSNSKQVQSYYYVDELGAITYTTGACVNSFTLPSSLKILLDEKSVRLFRLFKNNTTVDFEMSQVALNDTLTQTVLKFSNSMIELITLMPDSSMISSVPALTIREMANKNYPYEVVLSKDSLLEILNRLNIFNTDSRLLVQVSISNDTLTISGLNGEFTETLKTSSGTSVEEPYSFYLILKNLKLILDGYVEQYITMCFGDNKAIAFKKNGVVDIIPEPRVVN